MSPNPPFNGGDFLVIRFVLLFVSDLPVNQKGERRTEQNHGSENKQLVYLTHDHSAEKLAAHLKIKSQSDTFCKLEPKSVTSAEKSDKAVDHRPQKDEHANHLR